MCAAKRKTKPTAAARAIDAQARGEVTVRQHRIGYRAAVIDARHVASLASMLLRDDLPVLLLPR
jgi:hypothetical protein